MRSRTLAALAATCGLLAGCGGAPSPTLVALRARATRVCTSAGRSLGRIATPQTEAGGAAFLKRGIAVLRPELGRLRTLSPPTDDADVYRSALSAIDGEVRALRGAVRALGRQQDPVIAFKTLQQRLGQLESQADNAWQALQIRACLQR